MDFQSLLQMAFWLVVGHAVADFGLQTRWMNEAKNHVSRTLAHQGAPVWPAALAMHALINGGAVALATGSVFLGALETGAHMAIDYAKSERRFGFYADQALHLGCKAVWLSLAALGATPF